MNNSQHLFVYEGKYASVISLRVVTTMGISPKREVYYNVGLWDNAEYKGEPVGFINGPYHRLVVDSESQSLFKNDPVRNRIDEYEAQVFYQVRDHASIEPDGDVTMWLPIPVEIAYPNGDRVYTLVTHIVHTVEFVREAAFGELVEVENEVSFLPEWREGHDTKGNLLPVPKIDPLRCTVEGYRFDEVVGTIKATIIEHTTPATVKE